MRKRPGDMRLKQHIAKQYYDPQNLYEYVHAIHAPHILTHANTPLIDL